MLTLFCYSLSDGFFQIMCIASVNFNPNGAVTKSIIFLKNFSTKCLAIFIIKKMCKNMRLFICFQKLLNLWYQMASCLINVTDITAWANKIIDNKGFQRLWNSVFYVKYVTDFKKILIFKFLQKNLQSLLSLRLAFVEI